jgi:6-phosphogluconolactonase (cycloisomerase 2 family)
MAIDFPTSPSIGQKVTVSDLQYQWNGESWSIVTDKTILNNVVQSNDGNIDLSKGDYHKITIDENNFTSTLSFTNIPTGLKKWTVEYNTLIPSVNTFDLTNASYDNISIYVNSQDANPRGLTFKPDGTKMYILGSSTDTVYEYSLSTPWKVDTANHFGVLESVGTQESSPLGMYIKPDGTKLYVFGTATDSIHQYTITTPWDISTSSYDSISFNVGSQDAVPLSLFFKSDGTKMYMTGATNRVYQYSLSTPWEVNTASYDSVDFLIQEDSSVLDVIFKYDGSKMYMTGRTLDNIHQYSLSTAWDLSTVSYDSVSLDVGNLLSYPTAAYFKPDGTKLYIVGLTSDTVYQYSTESVITPSAPTITYPASVIWKQATAPVLTINQNLIIDFYSPDDGTTIYGIERINKDNT